MGTRSACSFPWFFQRAGGHNRIVVVAPTPIRTAQADPFERHFTPRELAELWRLDESTVRRLFQDEPGVLKIGNTGRRNKRDYVTLRIPESAAVRFYRERLGQ
jgi:hypothetical protein